MKLSVVVPFHWMENWQFFLTRCLESIEKQSFKDYEVILLKHSTMPITSNRAIESAQGELIKILYMDDYLAHENSLQEIVDAFTPETKWLVTGCLHQSGNETPHSYHEPTWNEYLYTGVNTVGSPSVLTLRREAMALFDTNLSWLLDCELYHRLHDLHGLPTILNTPNVVIGIHAGQTSNTMPMEEKQKEFIYMQKKHG